MPKGVKVRDLEVGSGPPVGRADVVRVALEFRLNRGDVISAERSRIVELARRDALAGLRYGIPGMREGGLRRLRVSPHLAYGTAGVPDMIPPGAVLVIDVRLLEIVNREAIVGEAIPPSMRVPCFVGGGRIEFGDKPVPEPGPGQLLLRVRANALCGSERGQFHHGSDVTPGHEAAGVVAAAGPGTQTPVGTLGVVFLMDFCGECRSCRLGLTNQCLAKRADMGFSHDGGYGPYELVHESCFFAVPPDLDAADATLLLDIMGTGGHALGRARCVRPDIESVAVAGAGPIGLGVLAMAKLTLGEALPVYIADTVAYRLALAERLGGIPVDAARTGLAAGVRRALPAGADIAVDTSGKQAGRQACVEALGQRGVLVCVGHGEGIALDVSRDLIGPERAVLGSEYFRYDELAPNLALLRQNLPYLRQVITHRFAIEDLQHAFETFFAGETGKVVAVQ